MHKLALVAVTALLSSATAAFAVSAAVKDACSADYAAFCSEHKVGTPGLRTCMHAHRKMLSDPCVKALGASSEVTAEEVREYKREMHKE
jgi:hypothetical protein